MKCSNKHKQAAAADDGERKQMLTWGRTAVSDAVLYWIIGHLNFTQYSNLICTVTTSVKYVTAQNRPYELLVQDVDERVNPVFSPLNVKYVRF